MIRRTQKGNPRRAAGANPRRAASTAAGVFARRGYGGASVEQIAEEAGYSHGAVYSNFDGKADLFLTVFEEYMAERARELAETQAAVAPEAPLEERARALADQWMERFARDRESFVLHMEFIAHAGRDPELAGRFGARSAALREAISGYIADYQEEAGVRLALSPDDLALAMRALGIGLAVEALVGPRACARTSTATSSSLETMSGEDLAAISRHPAGNRMNRRCLTHLIEHLGLHLGHIEMTVDWWKATHPETREDPLRS